MISQPAKNSGFDLTIDPQGITVYLPGSLLVNEDFPPDKLNVMLLTALETPSCMIVMPGADRYYFRSLDWHFTVLIHAVFQEEKWMAMEWMKNPDPAFIQELLKTGTFITGSNLG